MNKPEIQEMLYEYMKGYEKNLSQFMADVIKREGIAKQDVLEIKDSIKKIIEHLEQQDERSSKWREEIDKRFIELETSNKPIVSAFEKSITIRDFVQSSGKLLINLGLVVGAITALKIYFFSK